LTVAKPVSKPAYLGLITDSQLLLI
jgi:hypothetical protein